MRDTRRKYYRAKIALSWNKSCVLANIYRKQYLWGFIPYWHLLDTVRDFGQVDEWLDEKNEEALQAIKTRRITGGKEPVQAEAWG